MNEARPFVGRVLEARRKLTHDTEWPIAVAVLASILAMIEVTGVIVGRVPTEPVSSQIDLPDDGGNPTLALLLALLATAPVALVKRRLLLGAIMITLANYLTLISTHRPTAAAIAAQALVGYLVARHRSPRIWLLVLLPATAFVIAPLGVQAGDTTRAVVMLALTGIAATAGSMIRGRAEATARRALDRAAAGSLLENAARGERARIARELHDVVAHHISMISVQAEAARVTTVGLPVEGAQRFAAIGNTARDALTEMRRLLGVLREDAEPVRNRTPQPRLPQVIDLVDEARESGPGAARIIVRGHVVPLDPGMELSAYRIVQEALTNARRHAPGAAVDVEILYTADALRVLVRDNGPGSAPEAAGGAGLGLLGMRERAALVGGELRAGTARHGGFRVEAVLPIERSDP